MTGTGASFGIAGGPSNGGSIMSFGTTGTYIDPNPIISDPFASVSPPTDPSTTTPAGPTNNTGNPGTDTVAPGSNGCPSTATSNCTVYFPGKYTHDISVSASGGGKKFVVMAPGIYYMYGTNLSIASNGNMYALTGYKDNTTTTTPSLASCCGTGTGWGDSTNTPANSGALFYMTGSGTTPSIGAISVSSNSNVNLIGSPNSSSYLGILFFADRAAASQTHTFDGGGGLKLVGTIYTSSSTNSSTVYQTLQFSGNSGSSTLLSGEIVTSTLSLQGTPGITMNLDPSVTIKADKVALVQ
jgi:hypothetical protein